MARLTIRQASQQGFASTLTIHRHIKDGALPVYEDGDTKLVEVDDLIAVFGEPAGSMSAAATPGSGNDSVDMREFNRIKAELDQKSKKNMWLAADLAEAVRELKEKESSFEQERTRLLTVLEQAQALLLREAERTRERRRSAPDAAETGVMPENAEGALGAGIDGTDETVDPAEFETAPDDGVDIPPLATGADASVEEADTDPAAMPEPEPLVLETEEADEPKKNGADGDPIIVENPTTLPQGDSAPAEPIVLPDEPEQKDAVNPLMPPLEDPDSPRSSRRMLGATTWLFLFVIAGGGFVFYEFRLKVMTGVNKVLQALS